MCIERFSVMSFSALAVSSNVSEMSSLFHSCYYQHTSCLESYSGMSLYDCHRPSRPTIVYYFRVDQEFADSSPKVYIDCLKRSRYDWIRLCDLRAKHNNYMKVARVYVVSFKFPYGFALYKRSAFYKTCAYRFPFRSIVFQEAHNSFVLFYFC